MEIAMKSEGDPFKVMWQSFENPLEIMSTSSVENQWKSIESEDNPLKMIGDPFGNPMRIMWKSVEIP